MQPKHPLVLVALILSVALLVSGCRSGPDAPDTNITAPDAEKAAPSGEAPAALAWYSARDARDFLGGTWKWNEDTLEIKGDSASVTAKDGTVTRYTLRFDVPARVYFFEAESGASKSYTYTTDGDDVYLGRGAAGFVMEGSTYAVADGAGEGVVVFDAKTNKCVAIDRIADKWGAPVDVACALGEADGKPILEYSYPDGVEKKDDEPLMHKKSIEVVGSVLLGEQSKQNKIERLGK